MKWDKQSEEMLLRLKLDGLSVAAIAQELGTTTSSVKHKYTRLQQANNERSHHHPEEKTSQIEKILFGTNGLKILETHAGYGNLTKVYSKYAKIVTSFDIDPNKCKFIQEELLPNVDIINEDSLKGVYGLLSEGRKFDVVDVDPYGFPSHYFPALFELIEDGYLFITYPKYGCAQINNITKLHVKTFYDFDGGSNDAFLGNCIKTLKLQGMRTYRSVEVVDVADLQKVYRIALKIKRENAFIMCGYEHLTRRRNE